jgi:Mg-chelatase subunit ChlD
LRRLRGTWARMRVMRQRRAMLVRLTRHVDTTTSEKAKRLLRPDRHPDVIYPIEEPTDASLEGQAVSAPIGKRQCTTAPLRPQERGPEKLGPDEQRYYLSLCGAAGGLTTWAISSLAVRFVRVSQERYWMLEGAYLALAVVTISVVCSVLNARWNARLGRTPWRWQSLASVWAASFMTAGCCNTGFILARWLYAHHISPAEQIRACILAWAVTGAMVGASVSCWTHGLQPFRFLFSTLGGLMGGLVGGVLRACLLGVAPQWANALALTITGFAISLGSSVTILLVRKARIRLVSSRYVPGQREWEFARGDRVIIGHVPPGKQRIQLPDPNLAPAHAEILEQDGKLVIRPHVDNREPDGRPRLPIYVDDKELVDKSAPLGKESRVRVGDTTLEIVVASVAAAVLLSAQEAHATELGQLVATSKPRLVCCDVGSERPCFDAELAARGNRDPAGLRFPNREAARQAVTVKNGQEQTLETVWVIPNVAAEIQQQRYAFLLLDRSGSMKEPAGEGRSKFDVMKEAASTFLNGFEPGIDHVAIAPFSSRAVAKTIEDAPFTDDVETAREIVRSLPDPAGNTGLYSATLAALAVIDQARRQSAVEHADPPVVLLVVMTDGKNDVGHNDDDPDLLTGLDPVLERNRELNVPIVTIGFGSEDSVDRPSLARLAWPNAANSKFAATGAELHVAFRAARSTMVDRFRIRFKALEATRAQLTSQKFLIAANSMAGEHFEGRIDWTLPYLGQAPFEACPPPPGPGPEIGSAAVSQVEQNRAHSRERARPLAIWWMDYLTTLLVLASPIALAWHALPRLPGHPFIAWRNDRLRVRLHTSIRSARSKSRTVRKAVAERHAASRQ